MNLLTGLTPPSRVPTCKVRTLIDELETEDAQILKEAVDNVSKWPARTLANALQVRGLTISDLSISRHRNEACSC